MQEHRGMRPQDIVVLIKIATMTHENWYANGLAMELGIRNQEVSESIHRSVIAGLIAPNLRTLMKKEFLEFMEHGLKYAFPQKPCKIVKGVCTAYSAKPLSQLIPSKDVYVWPWRNGTAQGRSIRPLHAKVAEAALKDKALYELLALTDALRLNRPGEQKLIMAELRKRLM